MARDKRLGSSIAIDRLTAGFEYVGPLMDRAQAKALLSGTPLSTGAGAELSGAVQ